MSLKYINLLPTAEEIKKEFSLSSELAAKKAAFDKEVADAITGKSNKFIVVIGPCSADNEDAVLDYAHKLNKVRNQLSDKLIIIPRIYTNKPRTTGEGYKGMLHQPDPEKSQICMTALLPSENCTCMSLRRQVCLLLMRCSTQTT